MADDDNTRPVDPNASTADLGKPSPAALPEKIGRYRILEQIGEGGMGIVYLAEQTEPVQRRVALKVIKLGMDSKLVLARFEAERQALAMMDHPCVARIFDAGVSDDGRPYFVMEHVPGVPITDHCDRQRLNIAERLDLFMRVCEAVQHAHQKGIIHRDIKPGNILVSVRDGEAVPKVIDFGVAKALHQKLTEKTLFTEQGQLVGTPEYMSPEQAEMTAQDIDTRSDIYSLGVLLYELLTGALPFDPRSLRQAGFAEIQRFIREQEPPKPSTRLSNLGDASSACASARRVDQRSLERELRGDLDWIVMKALEKDRTRRYGTASDLARDIKHHINNDPVEATPPSRVYRLIRFGKRNRAGLNLSILTCTGTLALTWILVFLEDDIPGLRLISGTIIFIYFLPPILIAISLLVAWITRSRVGVFNAIVVMPVFVVVWAQLAWVSNSESPEERQEYELLDAYETITEYVGPFHARSRATAAALADLYVSWGKPGKAAVWRAKLAPPDEVEDTSPVTERDSNADKDN